MASDAPACGPSTSDTEPRGRKAPPLHEAARALLERGNHYQHEGLELSTGTGQQYAAALPCVRLEHAHGELLLALKREQGENPLGDARWQDYGGEARLLAWSLAHESRARRIGWPSRRCGDAIRGAGRCWATCRRCRCACACRAARSRPRRRPGCRSATCCCWAARMICWPACARIPRSTARCSACRRRAGPCGACSRAGRSPSRPRWRMRSIRCARSSPWPDSAWRPTGSPRSRQAPRWPGMRRWWAKAAIALQGRLGAGEVVALGDLLGIRIEELADGFQ